MIIDTHCHIDLYNNPEKILKESEIQGISVISMTNLPSHFELGYPHFGLAKKVRLALGMHPLMAKFHKREFGLFLNNLSKTSYIGEVGLDFSKEGISTKEIQLDTFSKVLKAISGQKKLLSIHSRNAENNVLELLIEYNIKCAIFHWYSGPLNLIDKIIEAGYYFSINPAMIRSEKGKKIISKIPLLRILTESDGPFIQIDNRQIESKDIKLVYQYLSSVLQKTEVEIDLLINSNFKKLLEGLK